jgi:hypothetical protein
MYVYIRLMSPTRYTNHVFTVLLENTHLGRRENVQKEMDYSLGKFISYYSPRHMHIETKMPMFTIRQLYVQFTMTIINTFPTV